MFSKLFVATKLVVLVVSFILLLLRPVLLPYLLAINILVAAVEAFYQSQFVIGLLGLVLVGWSLQLRYNETRDMYLIPYLMLYLIWNAWFYYQGFPSWYAAVPQVLSPVLVTLWVFYRGQKPENALLYFAVLRVVILLVS